VAKLFGFDLSGITDAISGFFGALGKLVNPITQSVTHVTNIFSAAEKLKQSVVDEIDGWKNFKQDIRLRQRVINLESAIQKTKELIEGIPAAWNSIKDIVKQAKDSFAQASPEAASNELTAEFSEGLSESGIRGLLSKFPRLLKGLEKALGVLAVIATALEQIANVIDDLQTILDELKRIRLEIEKLDTIFLSQSNPRKTLKLSDGKTIRIRVGKLHASA
jgi:hypothetical protein